MQWLNNVLKFEGSQLSGWWDKFKDNPEQLLIGAGDPFSTKMWNGILGTDYEPYVNQWGGPTEQAYTNAEAEGIDTKDSRQSHAVAQKIAQAYAMNYAAGVAGDAYGGASGGEEAAGTGGESAAGQGGGWQQALSKGLQGMGGGFNNAAQAGSDAAKGPRFGNTERYRDGNGWVYVSPREKQQ